MRVRSWPSRALATAGLALASTLLALALAEGGARIIAARQPVAIYGCNHRMDGTPLSDKAWVEDYLIQNPIKGVRHGFRPFGRWKFCYPAGSRRYFEMGGCVPYTVGPHGYRAPEGPWQKPPGRVRVLIIGDSVSFGIGVPADSVYSRHLEGWLRKERHDLDVVNMGVIGYMACEGAAVLARQGLERGPDLIVWQLHINDLIAMEGWAPSHVSLGLPESWTRRLSLIRLIERRLAITRHIREMKAQFGRHADPLVTDERTDNFLWSVEWVGKVMRQCDLPCVALLYPYPDYMHGDYPFMGLHDLFAQQCRRSRIVPLDLLPALKRLTQARLWVDASDNHPNDLGHRVMARALLDCLHEQFGPGLESIQPR